jgi:Tfp pilus assembly protein PilF
MRYRDTGKSIPEIAEELGVDAVIEGSVLRSGDRVRVTAQLIDAKTDQYLWADNFDRELRDIMALYSDLARAIAQEIEIAVTPEEETRLASPGPINPEAYEAYLRGSFHLRRMSPQDAETALSYYRLSLEKDPNYAAAHAGVGSVWVQRGSWFGVPPSEAYSKAKDAAQKALKLDDSSAEAHGVLATVNAYYEWDWGAAEREYERAIELNPSTAYTRVPYSMFLLAMKRPDDARIQIERALELDPLNATFQGFWGLHLLYTRRYDEAIAQCRETLGVNPNFLFAHACLLSSFHKKRMYEEAFPATKAYLSLLGHREAADALEREYVAGGYHAAMRSAADTLAARLSPNHLVAWNVAVLYTLAEEKDRALDWLEKAHEARMTDIVFLDSMPLWDSLHDEPRFQDLLARMNFPE